MPCILCRVPAAALRTQNEAARWRAQAWRAVTHPGAVRTRDAAAALLFTAELYALFKVGEFVGRGFTLFGYWP